MAGGILHQRASNLRRVLNFMAMPELADTTRKATRSSLASDARRIAEEIEGLYIQLEQVGALTTIRKHMTVHQEGVPRFDLLQAAKALRCYAGVLSMISAVTPKPKLSTENTQ